MIKPDELNDKMTALIEGMEANEYKFDETSRALISEIAEYARQTRIYERGKKYPLEIERTADSVFWHMLTKIAHAPTRFHVTCTCLMLMPILDDILKGCDKNE